jgi:hypothetical protein
MRQLAEFIFESEKFSHCASICPINDGTILTFYAGSWECRPDQAVYLAYHDGETYKGPIKIEEDGTGNPVIWSTGKDKAMLLYSKFEKYDTPNNVARWKYCTNWLMEITIKDGEIQLGSKTQLKTDPIEGYLGRCQPITYNGKLLLPIYDERQWYSQIWEADGDEYKELGRIGYREGYGEDRRNRGPLIQTTLWFDENNKLYSLSRSGTKHRKAWYSESEDGVEWSSPTLSSITNFNNSIVALHDPDNPTKNPHVIWNAMHEGDGGTRDHLMLGKLEDGGQSATEILQLNEEGSGGYPNYCFSNDLLHVVYTDNKKIKHTVINPK